MEEWSIIVGGVGLILAGASAALTLSSRVVWAPYALRVLAVVAIVDNVLLLFTAVSRQGWVATLRQNVESTMLMALLMALVGLGVHFSKWLRGLDIFLFLLAGVVQLSALGLRNVNSDVIEDAPWFLSHSLAFAVSGVAFVAGGAAGVAYIWINRSLRKKQMTQFIAEFAPLEALERFWKVMLVVGFPLFTYGVLTGFCGMFHDPTPGDPSPAEWLSDPFVIVSLLTWLLYAYLCVSLLFRVSIRGVRAARLTTVGMVMVAMVYLFAEHFSPVHR